MRKLLFTPILSYWAYLTLAAAMAVSHCLGGGAWGLLAGLGVVMVGATIEGLFEP